MISPSAELLNCLQLGKHKNVYYIGTEKRGVTIYKQQVRALNLIYALEKEGKINKSSNIAVIGGGIGGVTASAAALTRNCSVRLFEHKPFLLHLQTGCRTRWVHPNIYEWPGEGSEFPYAGLPLLDWKEGYSADVAQDFLAHYTRITLKHRNKYAECLSVKFDNIDFNSRTVSVLESGNKNLQDFADEYDVIILATGFGLETGVNSRNPIGHNSSYWRNDDLDQPYIGNPDSPVRNIVISGTGDGACIDLMRSVLKNFHQGRFTAELFSRCDNASELKRLINHIRLIADAHGCSGTWLYDQLLDLPSDEVNQVKSYLRSQLRQDTNVVLLGRAESYRNIFTTERMSVFNAFVVSLLKTMGVFKYYGISKTKKAKDDIIEATLLRAERDGTIFKYFPYNMLIERHGPEKNIKANFKALGLKRISLNDSKNTANRIWEPGWPNPSTTGSFGVEFVPPLSKAIATTFVDILGETLSFYHKDKQNYSFRVTINRFIQINGDIFFQQVCRYYGNGQTSDTSKIGRIFPAQFGLVGYCALHQQPVLLKRLADFDETIQMMGIERLMAEPIRTELNAMFGIPIFSVLPNGKKVINCVVYIDTSEINFFTKQVLDIIVNSCIGFIKNIDNMVSLSEIKVSENSINPDIILDSHMTFHDFESLKIGGEIEESLGDLNLKFANITTFDLYE